jgi:hypothetical protein
MNEEKQVDRDHSKLPVKKVKFCPLLDCNIKNMTYGKVYDIFQVQKPRNTLREDERYEIENDSGEKVWMNQKYFDELPLREFDNEFLKDEIKRQAFENLWKPESAEELAEKIESVRNKPVEELNEAACEELKELSGLNEEPEYVKCSPRSWTWDASDRKIFTDPHKEVFGLDNIDVILANVAKEFPSTDPVYPSIHPDDVLGLLRKKMGYEFSIQGDFLAVNDMTTKFTKDSIDTAHRGLKCIVGDRKATKMVARAIQSQLEKIF